MLEKNSNPEELSKELSKEIKNLPLPMGLLKRYLKKVDSGLYNKLTSGKKEDLTEGLKLVNDKLPLLPPNSVSNNVLESGKKMISTALNKLKSNNLSISRAVADVASTASNIVSSIASA